MKRIVTIAAALLITASVFAQAPEKMSYQAVIRDATDALITSQAIGMQISVLQGSLTGIPVYVETQTPTSNINGLVSLEIGNGTNVSGNFNTIDWSNGPYFIKTETDPTGGTAYTISGTSQLMSVPFALHAKTADNFTGTITETDPVFGAWDKSTGISITESQISDLTHTVDNDTQLDETAVDGFVANNGYLTSFTEIDGSITNEIQTISRTGTTVTLTNGGAFTDSVGVYTAGSGITISASNVISTGSHYLGEEFDGGIIYYLYIGSDGNQHGLIVNKAEITAQWQASGTLTNANRTEDGVYNTALMTSSAAATYVNGLGLGWYLPSIDELDLLFYNRFLTNKALRSASATLLSGTAYYWCSTEYNNTSAYSFAFTNGNAYLSPKASTSSVRAVRAF